MRTVIQHVLRPGLVSVQAPQGSSVLGVGVDALARPVAFLLVDTDRPACWRVLHVGETGEAVSDAVAPAGYRGSVSTKAGEQLHVFDLGER
jgi:hypothetical protein